MTVLRAVLILILCFNILSSHAEDLRYRVLDIDKVIDSSVAYVEFKSKLDKANQKYQKEIEFYEAQLISLDKQMKSSKTNKEQIIKIKQTIILYESKVQELMQKRKDVNDQASDKAFGIMREAIDKLVYEYAKANKLNVIFSRMQVMYFSDAVDITEEILKSLNKVLPKIDVVVWCHKRMKASDLNPSSPRTN